jgi:hypothetical protein
VIPDNGQRKKKGTSRNMPAGLRVFDGVKSLTARDLVDNVSQAAKLGFDF